MGRPEHQGRLAFTYSNPNLFDVRLEALYIGNQVARNISFEEPDIVSPSDTGSVVYTDLFISKTFDRNGGDSETMVYAGLNNVFDKEPPIPALGLTARSAAGNYDQMGRNFVLGARLSF